MSQETPKDDPPQRTDKGSIRQTEKPWKGVPEKDQFDPKRERPDLENWKDTNTH